MKPNLSDVLPLLNASCGDVLKAALLHEFFPTLPKINPMWLKCPTGEVEAAFAAFKTSTAPVSQADQLKAEVLADHAKIEDVKEVRFIDPTIQKLVRENTTAKPVAVMPRDIRFDDVPVGAREPVVADIEVPLITLEEAAKEFGYSYGGMVLRLKNAGLDGVRVQGKGKAKFFSRAKVEELCASKGRHLK